MYWFFVGDCKSVFKRKRIEKEYKKQTQQIASKCKMQNAKKKKKLTY